MTATTRRRDPRIVIVGAGMSGIAAAHVLKQAGFTDFTILEKGSDVGGVWHWNRYPGLRATCPPTATNSRSRPSRTGATCGRPVTRSSGTTATSSTIFS